MDSNETSNTAYSLNNSTSSTYYFQTESIQIDIESSRVRNIDDFMHIYIIVYYPMHVATDSSWRAEANQLNGCGSVWESCICDCETIRCKENCQ